ncbi:hypothetical protein [Nocardioides pacificus]
MARRLVLHVGAMKSGTSFIQNVLAGNRELLLEQGVLFPGARWRTQVSAVQDLIARGGADQEPMAPDGPWNRLAAEVREWSDTAVISMEFLGPRGPEKIQQVVDSFPGTELQVVLTVRDLARSIPAMWQESVQNGSVVTWDQFLAAVRADDGKPGPAKWFWKHQRVSLLARRWVEGVGRDRFTLITVPPKGAPHDLLWHRFAEVAGIDPGSCSLDVLANPSIGAASAMVMRELNEALAADPLSKRDYHNFVKHALAKRGLAARQRAEPTLGLDEKWVQRRGNREIDALRALDLRIVGDLAELAPRPVPGVHTRDIDVSLQLEAAVDGLARAVRLLAETDHANRRSKKGTR